jgi:hypothetical protein
MPIAEPMITLKGVFSWMLVKTLTARQVISEISELSALSSGKEVTN